ncbi:MAG: hypothetical protein P4L87_25075 [Formivibrio sp.]|nr:hypothetical protein [Formivibrio sp.]
MERVVEVFCCGACDDIHDTYEDAQECCEPKVTTMFKCSECGVIHINEDDAESCCQEGADEDHNIDGRLYMASKLELERAGQLCLL